jgi:hypothetical protein
MSQHQGENVPPPPSTSFALLRDEDEDSVRNSFTTSGIASARHHEDGATAERHQQQQGDHPLATSSFIDEANSIAVASPPRTTTSFYDPRGGGGLPTSSSFPYAAFPPEQQTNRTSSSSSGRNHNVTTATAGGAPPILLHEALTAAELAKLRNWLSRLPQFPPTDDVAAADVATAAGATPRSAVATTTATTAATATATTNSAAIHHPPVHNNNNTTTTNNNTNNNRKAVCYDPNYNMMIPANLSMASTAKSCSTSTVNSDYPVFGKSTHAWAIYADAPKKRAGKLDRLVGIFIICFQLFTYYLFAAEAIEDFKEGQVPVTTSHMDCWSTENSPTEDQLVCEAGRTHDLDSFVAFFMLGIFLAADFIQAFKVIRIAECGSQAVFAAFAVIEVVAAYSAATMAVAYQLYVGEVTDAVEVGVGLLFIRELSQRTYSGLQDSDEGKGAKRYKVFFSVLGALVVVGMFTEHLCEFMLANKQDGDV